MQLYLYTYNWMDNAIAESSFANLDQEVLCQCVFGSSLSRGSSIFAALAFVDNTVRIYSLDPVHSLTRLSLITLQA